MRENISKKCQKVLIAEDTQSNFLLLQSILKDKYELIWALDGEEALSKYRESNPDLILMDIRMPHMNGIEATQYIRITNKNIPIIAVTAFTYDTDVEEVLRAGCNSYLPKPIKPKELIIKIEELLSNR